MLSPQTKSLDVRTALKQGIHLLREAQIPSDTLAAELLLLHVTRRDRTWLYAHSEEILDPQTIESYFSLLRRRAVRELRSGRDPKLTGEGLTIVDIGTGSGCIAVALAKELPAAKIYATDISPAALKVAQRNATQLGHSNRITFLESNLLVAFAPSPNQSLAFDLIISNPPYVGRKESTTLPIEVRDHEPVHALYGGEEGYELYGLLVPEAARHLKPSGLLVLELGHDSLPAVRPLFDSPEWTNLLVTNDLAAIPRVLSAERT